MNILQDIFRDHYEIIELTCHPRDVEMENIERMIDCGDPELGGTVYACGKCGHTKYVPFRCHSRFCPTCGALYSVKRTTAMSFKLVDVPHRHCVFTIAEELRPFFLADRSLLNLLFQAVNQVISRFFYNLNHKRHFVPGFICVLHTFGRDLKWNPHIHCLLSEGGFDKDGFWRSVTYFNYKFLRNAFQTVLLNLMESRLPPDFKKVKAQVYLHSAHGFYVYAKPRKCESKQILKYIGRFLLHNILRLCYPYSKAEVIPSMSQDPILLRRKYIQDPPVGLSPDDISNMSIDELLDMDYFLNENDDDIFDLDKADLEDNFFFF